MAEVLKDKKRFVMNSALSLFLSCGSFVVIYLRCGTFFETIDDRFITEILSGSMTGTPDAHAIYIHYFLGSLFKELYLITRDVQWWGVFLAICFISSFATIFYGVLNSARNLMQYCLAVVVCLLVVVINLYHFTIFQYTTIAGIMAATGYYLLLCSKNKKSLAGFVFFELIAYFVRSKAMLLVQPIGIVAWAMFYCAEMQWKKETLYKFIKAGLKLVLTIFAIIFFSWSTNFFAGIVRKSGKLFPNIMRHVHICLIIARVIPMTR